MHTRKLKAQSSMEYLMTYGWAILIIAVVLGALFGLGVFSNGALLGSSCISSPGFLCSQLALTLGRPGASNVTLNFNFGATLGYTIYNVGLGCAAISTSAGFPFVSGSGNNFNAIVYISNSGAATSNTATYPANGVLTLTNGQSLQVSNLNCFSSTGTVLTASTSPLGTSFSGSIWLNYTTAAGAPTAPSGTNPMLITKIGTLTTRVV